MIIRVWNILTGWLKYNILLSSPSLPFFFTEIHDSAVGKSSTSVLRKDCTSNSAALIPGDGLGGTASRKVLLTVFHLLLGGFCTSSQIELAWIESSALLPCMSAKCWTNADSCDNILDPLVFQVMCLENLFQKWILYMVQLRPTQKGRQMSRQTLKRRLRSWLLSSKQNPIISQPSRNLQAANCISSDLKGQIQLNYIELAAFAKFGESDPIYPVLNLRWCLTSGSQEVGCLASFKLWSSCI